MWKSGASGVGVKLWTYVDILGGRAFSNTISVNSLFKKLKQDGLVIQDEKKLRNYYLANETLEIIKKMKKL